MKQGLKWNRTAQRYRQKKETGWGLKQDIAITLTTNYSFTMAYEAQGRLVAVYDTVQRSEKFRTREFVIEVNEELRDRTITNYVKFQLVQDRVTIIDAYRTGDTVKVQFNIKGSKWERNGQVNYITNLDAWRIESVGTAMSGSGQAEMPGTTAGGSIPPAPQPADDLPF
jgi:hypothetical protein